MARKGFKRNFAPLNILTGEQVADIHRSTLRVLEETGFRIDHERALKLLEKNGCKVDYSNNRVRFPHWLVEDCIRMCPKSFRIKARNPENDVIIGDNNLVFGTACGMHTVDLDTWEPRPPTKKEFEEAVVILDALDTPIISTNYYPWFGWEDVPPVMGIAEGLATRIRNTSKVVGEGHSCNCEIFTIAMAQAVGADLINGASSSPPLTYNEEGVEALWRYVEAGFPIRIAEGPTMGGTAPVTIAGAVVHNNVSTLATIVLIQLIKPGTRVLATAISMPLDMRSGLLSFGNIGLSLNQATNAQYWRSLSIPVNHGSGFSSSKLIDFQCGYERAISATISALSGVSLFQITGGMYGELTLHPLQMILDDDICNMIGRFVEGVEVNDETLAVDLINEVGPIPGNYLDKAHTRKWWKRERYLPKAADTLGIPEWMERGKKNALDYAKERMEEILATHKPDPLTPKQQEDIESILKEAWDYYRKRDML